MKQLILGIAAVTLLSTAPVLGAEHEIEPTCHKKQAVEAVEENETLKTCPMKEGDKKCHKTEGDKKCHNTEGEKKVKNVWDEDDDYLYEG